MKIITVIGARPQFIKSAMVSKELSSNNHIETSIHTGQHFDENMSSVFFDELGIPKPKYNLGIHSLPHGAMTGQQMAAIEKILIKEKPDWVLVYGDTNSTLAGALAASKLRIPVAHVEAGLRSFNRRMPEEINRILTDHISKSLFAPTKIAVDNLQNEGVQKQFVHLVGDVMYDAVLNYSKQVEKNIDLLDRFNIEPKNYILATIHRQENTDDKEKLKNIFSALAEAPKLVVFPIHPRTKKILDKYNIKINGQIIPIDPVGYLDMILLEKNAYKIATDSGGVQKEAYFHGVPCLTLRNETEWVELVKAGVNHLVGADKNKILEVLNTKESDFKNQLLYGDGFAAKKIINGLIKDTS